MKKSGKIKTFSLCLLSLPFFCSCQANEALPLPEIRQSSYDEFVRLPGRTRCIDRMLSDDPDDSTALGNAYPEIDLSEIKTLPVYEKNEGGYLFSDKEIEDYSSEVNEIGRLFGAEFERFFYGDEYKAFDADYDKKRLSFYVGAENTSPDCQGAFEADSYGWDFWIDESIAEDVFADCIERDLDSFDNGLLNNKDNDVYINAVQKLDEILSLPLSEDTKEYLECLFESLKSAAPALFRENYPYICRGRGSGTRYSQRGDPIWLRCTDYDLSSEKGRLLDYNGFVSGYRISFYDDEYGNRDYVGVSFSPNTNKLLGEYRIISPEKAAETLGLVESEKLAILYIESQYEDKTVLRPVYAKYTYQRDLFHPQHYIDAIL